MSKECWAEQADRLAMMADGGQAWDLSPNDRAAIRSALERVAKLEAENVRLEAIINTPELASFSTGVALEAVHQRERWGSEHDAGKEPSDWYWLLGYLGGKALAAHLAGNREKALHHTISSAAVLANWHAAIMGTHTAMRPGIDGQAVVGNGESR